MNEQEFENKFQPIKDTLENQGIEVHARDYDGIVVKKLECNNTRGCGDQTHIEFTGEQMEMFPYLASYKYFNNPKNNGDFKSFYTFKMPLSLNRDNLRYLLENHESYSRDYFGSEKIFDKKKIELNESISLLKKLVYSEGSSNKIDSHSTLLRGLKERNQHTEISQIKSSDKVFEALRWLLPKNSYLIILKLRKKVKFEVYGILLNDAKKISHLHLKFIYYHNSQDEKTLVPLENFKTKYNKNKEDVDDNFFGENKLLYGVPGVGKSWTIKNVICDGVAEDHIERVVFHPDYTYSDFIGQILPKISDNGVEYKFTPGPFTNILKKAHNSSHEKFYLIIEEINRGNAPAIFGDVFQLLDRMKKDKYDFKKETIVKKGTSEFGVTNSEIAKEVYNNEEHKVRIPHNLSIIATMNTSDQNVFTLDTAFKRRWHMEMIENNFDKPKFKDTIIPNSNPNMNITWKIFGTAFNEIILEDSISTLSSEDKRLGAYFVDEEDLSSPKRFAEKVLMYLWDDVFKFSRENYFKKMDNEPFSLEYFIEKFENEQDILKIFTPRVETKFGELLRIENEKKSAYGNENDSD